MSKELVRWWSFFIGTLAITAIAMLMGSYEHIATHEATLYFSYSVWLVYTSLSLIVGWKIAHKDPDVEVLWFAAEQIMALGMCGTIAGLIMVFRGFFENFDLQDAEKSKHLITVLAGGVAVALYTTLFGLVYSVFLKIQLVIAENVQKSV